MSQVICLSVRSALPKELDDAVANAVGRVSVGGVERGEWGELDRKLKALPRQAVPEFC